MKEDLIKSRIERAKALLNTTHNGALATVNQDGSPHNSPVFLLFSKKLDAMYWASDPEALHSKNIKRTGQVFVVIYENDTSGGLYIKADEAEELSGLKLSEALIVRNDFRASQGKEALPASFYSGKSPQRMYCAKPMNFYVNISLKDSRGNIIKDKRHEIYLYDLFDNHYA